MARPPPALLIRPISPCRGWDIHIIRHTQLSVSRSLTGISLIRLRLLSGTPYAVQLPRMFVLAVLLVTGGPICCSCGRRLAIPGVQDRQDFLRVEPHRLLGRRIGRAAEAERGTQFEFADRRPAGSRSRRIRSGVPQPPPSGTPRRCRRGRLPSPIRPSSRRRRSL